MKHFLIFCFSIFSLLVNAQKGYFAFPVKHKIKLAGSFGELRKNHFHAGIDIKSTQGKSGDPIFAAAEGHISRIRVSNMGYGKCLYIDHTNGYTTVYAHLSKFTPEIEALVLEKQKMLKDYQVDIYLKKKTFTFKKGEKIGLMGNTGRSYGPHLHFEIRETASEIPQNPFLFGIAPGDDHKPVIQEINIIELTPDFQVKNRKSIDKDKQGHFISGRDDITSDLIGISMKGYDKMNDANNKNGIYQVEMYVNDKLHYTYKTDAVSFENMKDINAHIDYAHKMRDNGTFANCYILPGDELQIYDRKLGNGVIKIPENKTTNIKIIAKDFHHNKEEISFTINRGNTLSNFDKTFYKIIKQGRKDSMKVFSSTIFFPANALAKDLYFNYGESQNESLTEYQIGDKYTPIFSNIFFKTKPKYLPKQKNKIVLLYQDIDKPEAYPTIVKNGIVKAKIDKLGEYTLAVDTIPPTIKRIPTKSKTTLYFSVSHNFELQKYGHFKYNVFIDGRWIPVRWDTMKDRLVVYVGNLSKGIHNLKIVASDQSHNTTEYRQKITIE